MCDQSNRDNWKALYAMCNNHLDQKLIADAGRLYRESASNISPHRGEQTDRIGADRLMADHEKAKLQLAERALHYVLCGYHISAPIEEESGNVYASMQVNGLHGAIIWRDTQLTAHT